MRRDLIEKQDWSGAVLPLRQQIVDQTNHDMRIGYYTDTYHRTEAGWRLHTRSMTFLHKSGSRDSGRAHDPTRPAPTKS